MEVNFSPSTKRQYLPLMAALFFYQLWLYWDFLPAAYRADHLQFLQERSFYDNMWEHIWHSLSYNRSRHLLPGDTFLFRPAMTGLLSVIDNLFPGQLYIRGALAMTFHFLLMASLFWVFRPQLGFPLLLSLALWFSSAWVGLEMIAWPHISPYILSLVFFTLGVTTKGAWKGPLFFMTLCFHEFFFVILLAMALLRLYHRDPLANKIPQDFLFPLVSYLTLNLLSYHSYDLSHVEAKEILYSFKSIIPCLLILGTSLSFFLFPATLSYGQLRPDDRLYTLDPQFTHRGLYIVGFFLFIFMLRKLLSKKRPPSTWERVGILLCLVTATGVGLGRVVQRGVPYFQLSSYYYYFMSFGYFVLFICTTLRLKKKGLAILSIFALINTFVAATQIKQEGKRSLGLRQTVHSTLTQASSFMTNLPMTCLKEDISTLKKNVPLLDIYQMWACQRHDKRLPLTLEKRTSGHVLVTPHGQQFPLKIVNDHNLGHLDDK